MSHKRVVFNLIVAITTLAIWLGCAALANPQSMFVPQSVTTNGSTVLLLGNFANDGGNDFVTVDSNGAFECIPNDGGTYATAPVVSMLYPPQPVSAFASGPLISGQNDFILTGAPGASFYTYNFTSACQINFFGSYPEGGDTPNAIIVTNTQLRNDGPGPWVVLSLWDTNMAAADKIYDNNYGNLSAPGGYSDGPSTGALVGNFGSGDTYGYNSAFEDANGILKFHRAASTSTVTTPTEISGTVQSVINTPNGNVYISSISGSTLYLTPLTWTSYTSPVLGTSESFNFAANVTAVASGYFGGSQPDGIAVALTNGTVALLLDADGTGNWSVTQTLNVAANVSLNTIATPILTTSGPYASQNDIVTQGSNGIAYILWQKYASLVVANPISLNFPAPGTTLLVGSAATPQSVVLANQGTANLAWNSFSFTGANAADFWESDNCSGQLLVPGASCTLTVEYTPSEFLAESATLVLSSSATNSPFSIPLSAAAAPAPTVTLSTSSLVFGTVKQNTSEILPLTITNTGGYNLSFVSLNISPVGDFSLTNNCLALLGPGLSCQIMVQFAPTVISTESATLTITTNALSSPNTVSLSGTGVPETESLGVTVAGNGSGTVTGNGINCPSVCSVTPTAGTAISLTASPASGSFFTGWTPTGGTATVNSFTMPASNVSLTATFTAIINVISTPTTSLTFAAQNFNTQSAAQIVTLSSGTSNVPINNFNISVGTGFLQTNSCSTLAVGSTCTIDLAFDPTTPGQASYSSALTVTSSANTIIIPVTGNAQESPAITVQPASQTVLAPASATFSVTAACIPACQYQWYSAGGAITGATSSTYTLSQTNLTENGAAYFVVVSNSVASVQSTTATLTVNAVPVFTTQPQSQQANLGSSVTFTAGASGNPAPTITWTVNGGPVVATGNSYTISAVTQAMSGETILVTATNSVGQAQSTPAILTTSCTAISSVVLYYGASPAPASITVVQGTSMVFTVQQTGGSSPLTYQWLVGGQPSGSAASLNFTAGPNTSVSVSVSNGCTNPVNSTTTQITVTPAETQALTSISFANSSPGSGTDVGTVTLQYPDTLQAVTVKLFATDSNETGQSSYAVLVPATVTIPVGQKSVTFNATVTPQTQAVTTTITATTTNVVSTTLSVAAAPIPPSFTFVLNPATASVTAGQPATSVINVTPTNGFNGAITYTCTDPASKSTCSISGTPAVLSITTTAPTTSSGFAGPGILGVLFGALSLLIIPRKKLRAALAAFILAFALTSLVACQGGSGGSTQTPPPPIQVPGTPSGTYNVVVTGTSGTTTASSTFVLVVK